MVGFQPKESGLGSDNKKWVGSDQEVGIFQVGSNGNLNRLGRRLLKPTHQKVDRFRQSLARDLCLAPCLRGFLPSSFGKKGFHQNLVVFFCLIQVKTKEKKRTLPKLNSVFQKFSSITPRSVG